MRKLGLVVIGFALAAPAQASEGHGGEEHAFPFHHVSLFVGGASESRPATASEHDFALGAEYEVRLAPRWGIGALVEGVGHDTIRDLVVLGLGSYHFGGGFRVVTGPGVEFGQDHDEFVFRIGTGYEVVYGTGFTLAPEINVDLIGDEKTTWVYGLAFGKEF
jgi:hypothetical protein